VLATAEETLTPPDSLAINQQIARAIKATGNNIYLVEQPCKTQCLVELPARFRSTFWIKRGSYVVIDTTAQDERDNKIGGEIVNIVRDEKAWRKAAFWYLLPSPFHPIQFLVEDHILTNICLFRPKEFVKQPVVAAIDSDDEDESRVGQMPPSDDESDA
jgi:probable RNA-binding protein EIF1AD